MKSEEKQLDLLLYNLGGMRAVNKRVSNNKNRNQKSVKVTKQLEQRATVPTVRSFNKAQQKVVPVNNSKVNLNPTNSQRKNTSQKPVVVHNNRPVPNANNSQRKNANQKPAPINKKANSTNIQRNKTAQIPAKVQKNKSTSKQINTQRNKQEQTTQVIKNVTQNKAIATPSQEEVDLEFRLKLQIAYEQTKDRISKNILAIRKKMPGYVYPSRQEMLMDQQTKENVPESK